MSVSVLINSNKKIALAGLLIGLFSSSIQAQSDNSIERHQQVEQQKEQLTHASDFKANKTVKERTLLSTDVKKDDAVAPKKVNQKQ